jgi:hypothetical protein
MMALTGAVANGDDTTTERKTTEPKVPQLKRARRLRAPARALFAVRSCVRRWWLPRRQLRPTRGERVLLE